MLEYYDKRAPEYDDWYEGRGLFAGRARPGWHDELTALIAALGALAPARTLDVACGTGYLTRHLPGVITGLDASDAMLAIARERIPGGSVVRGDALAPPFAGGSFERVAACHFYGHLETPQRTRFLAQALRLAPELLVVDSARRPDVPAARIDPRKLSDGSRHAVFKRWFEPGELREELGGGELVHAGDWFVALLVRTVRG